MRPTRMSIKAIAVALMLVIIAGCGNIPDIKPFADATAEMATTLRKGYSHDEALMLSAIDVTSDETSQKLRDKLKELKKVWEPTENALNALAAYSDALAALADAGKKGKETTEALFNSLNGLVGAVSNLTIPANVITLAGAIGRKIAAAKAEKDIKKAVEAVADAIGGENGVAEILQMNFAELKRINQSLGDDIEANLLVKNRHLIGYHDQLTEGDLRTQRILTKILEFEDLPNKVREQAARVRQTDAAAADMMLAKIDEGKRDVLNDLRQIDGGLNLPASVPIDDAARVSEAVNHPDLSKRLEKRREELLVISKGYRAELERIAADYKVANDKIEAIRARTRSGNEIFEKSGKAIKAWAKAHNDLRLTLEKKHNRVTVLELLSIVKEIAETLKQGEA